MSLLKVDRLEKSFEGLRAVQDLSFEIERGESVGIIGPNGAGKTTTFNLIAGTLRPDDGRILLEGEEITTLPPHVRARKGISRTFQISRPLLGMTVLENVLLSTPHHPGERLPLALFRRTWRAVEESSKEDASRALERVGLQGMEERPASELSGGQRRLLEIARALLTRPKILLLDEPTSGLHGAIARVVLDRLEEIRRSERIALLVVEHNLDVVFTRCERILVLSGGRLLLEGPPERVREDPRVLEAYLGGVGS